MLAVLLADLTVAVMLARYFLEAPSGLELKKVYYSTVQLVVMMAQQRLDLRRHCQVSALVVKRGQQRVLQTVRLVAQMRVSS